MTDPILKQIEKIKEEQIKELQALLHKDENFKNNILLFVDDNGETEFNLYGQSFKLKLELID